MVLKVFGRAFLEDIPDTLKLKILGHKKEAELKSDTLTVRLFGIRAFGAILETKISSGISIADMLNIKMKSPRVLENAVDEGEKFIVELTKYTPNEVKIVEETCLNLLVETSPESKLELFTDMFAHKIINKFIEEAKDSKIPDEKLVRFLESLVDVDTKRKQRLIKSMRSLVEKL